MRSNADHFSIEIRNKFTAALNSSGSKRVIVLLCNKSMLGGSVKVTNLPIEGRVLPKSLYWEVTEVTVHIVQ
jgi:hypothetical protein